MKWKGDSNLSEKRIRSNVSKDDPGSQKQNGGIDRKNINKDLEELKYK